MSLSGRIRGSVGSTPLNTLSDVVVTLPARGDVIAWNGARFRNRPGETFNVRDYGAIGNGVADDTAAIQSAIDAATAIGGGIVRFPTGTYLCNTITTAAGLPWILSIVADNIRLEGVPGALLKTTADAYLVMAFGAGKPAGMASWASNELADATFFAINPASKDETTVTTVTAANAANFAVDDWVAIRTGQTIGGSIDQPDAEINRVLSADAGTGVVTLHYPLAKPYAQEYFISGTDGGTSTAVTANPAILGIAKVTDRIISGFALRGLAVEGLNISRGLINTGQMVNYEVTDCSITCNHVMHGGKGSRFARWLRNRIRITGDDYLWSIATDAYCGDIEIAENRVVARRSSPLHIHEGSYRINIHDNEFINGTAKNGTDYMVSILARAYDIRVNDNLMSGSGFSSGIRVDAFCTGGGVIRGNTVLGSPASGEIVVLASGWEVEGNRPTNGKINFVLGSPSAGTRNLANGRPSMPQRVTGGWVADDFQTETIVRLPAFCVVDQVNLQVQQAFNSSGTDLLEVGILSDHDAFAVAVDVSTIGIKTVTGGVQLGLYQASEQDVVAYYTSGGSAPTTGRALVEIFWHRVEGQVP